MTRLETFRLKSMWGNYSFDFACSMARGIGDKNVVRNENERSGFIFSRQDADNFNSFIDNSGLIDLPLGDRIFTWMNKARTKLSELDRFLISEEAAEALPDVRVTAIDHLSSDQNLILLLWSFALMVTGTGAHFLGLGPWGWVSRHPKGCTGSGFPADLNLFENLILLHVSRSDFGPIPFKLFHSWLLRDSFDKVIKTKLPRLEEHNFGRKLLSHEIASSKLELNNDIL
ncbi:RNA-directed DNA polymerase, eukaryota, reverse transcriptase zinc-binding domain protein [Tanacetum coccineum]